MVLTMGQSGPGSNGNEGGLYIPQISKAEASPSFNANSPHSLGEGSYPLVVMESA